MGRFWTTVAVGASICASALLAASPAWAGYHAYVTNYTSGTVSQFSVGADGSLTPTGTPQPAGSEAYYIAISPTGRGAYVTTYNATNKVFQYGIGSGGALSPLSPASVSDPGGPYPLTASPDGKYVYVGNFDNNTISQYAIGSGNTLSAIGTAVSTGSGPYDVAETPDGKHVYVANVSDDTISEYSVGAGGALSPSSGAPTAPTGKSPSYMAITPDGKYLYVTNGSSDDTVSEFSIGANGSLTPLSTPTVATGSYPFALAMSPAGNYVFVTNITDSTISKYAVGANGELSPVGTPTSTGTDPYVALVSPDGKTLYVSDEGHATVSQYTIGAGGTLTPKSTPTVATGTDPWGIGVTPDSGPAASFTDVVGAVGKTTSFSGGGSDADESITGYAWNFGDGHTGSGQSVSHTFAHTGTYTVTLTETDSIGCSAYGPFSGFAGGYTGHMAACALDPAAVKTTTVTIKAPHIKISKIHTSRKGVRFKAKDTGAPFSGRVTLYTTEHLKGKHVIGLTAKVHKKTVSVGTVKFSLAVGKSKTIFVKLNGKGRHLLAEFGKLPIELKITTTENGKTVTLVKRKLTIKK